MAATTLAATRTALAAVLVNVTEAHTYRRRQTNPQYPCLLVGWPDEFDVRPTFGEARDVTVPVWVGCEVGDDDSSDDLLSSLLESAVTQLTSNSAWDVQPASNFGEQLLDDGRVIIWCSLPVRVLT